MGSNIGAYLDQLWVSNIVKIKYNKEVTNKNLHGWSLPIPIDNNAIRKTTIPMDESRELRLQHTNAYKLIFNSSIYIALYASACLCKVVLSQNYHQNSVGQSSFISFVTHTACLLLKLKRFILLVMCTAGKRFYCGINRKICKLLH